jgi:hypothetical protein
LRASPTGFPPGVAWATEKTGTKVNLKLSKMRRLPLILRRMKTNSLGLLVAGNDYNQLLRTQQIYSINPYFSGGNGRVLNI